MNKEELILKLDEWILEQKYQEYSDNTLKQYRANVLKFINWIPEDEPITKITTIDYKKYLMSLSNSSKSINVWIVSLNKYLRWLGLNDLTIKKLKSQQQSSNEESLTIADYKRLLRISKRIGNDQLYYIIKVLAMTGCRIGELKYFTVENIDKTPRKNIKVYNKKKEREIVIRQDLSRELKKYYKSKKIKSGYIFLSNNPKCHDKMPRESTIWRQMQKVAGLARINKEKAHAHNFRHLFAQVFLESYPENVLDLADLLGHNDLKTTRIYTKTSGDQKRKKLEKIKF